MSSYRRWEIIRLSNFVSHGYYRKCIHERVIEPRHVEIGPVIWSLLLYHDIMMPSTMWTRGA